jgi:sugar phosphate isomerase/epimerase
MEDKIMWSGQSKHWGKLEEATKLWADLGMKYIMVKHTLDSPLLDIAGDLEKHTFEKLSSLQKEFGVNYHFHPFDIKVKGQFLTTSKPGDRKVISNLLQGLDQMIDKYGFYPLITLHLPFFWSPKRQIKIPEPDALKQSIDFYSQFDLKAKVAFETMHSPYSNENGVSAAIGYKAEHFINVLGDNRKGYGICIDTGHENLSCDNTRKILDLPYRVFSMHLHGNRKCEDSHELPTRQNIRDYDATLAAIKKCTGPIVLEIRDYGYSKDDIRKCMEDWEKAQPQISQPADIQNLY